MSTIDQNQPAYADIKKGLEMKMQDTYKDQVLTSKRIYYYPDGKIAESVYYTNNKLDGNRWVYDNASKPLVSELWKEGKLITRVDYAASRKARQSVADSMNQIL